MDTPPITWTPEKIRFLQQTLGADRADKLLRELRVAGGTKDDTGARTGRKDYTLGTYTAAGFARLIGDVANDGTLTPADKVGLVSAAASELEPTLGDNQYAGFLRRAVEHALLESVQALDTGGADATVAALVDELLRGLAGRLHLVFDHLGRVRPEAVGTMPLADVKETRPLAALWQACGLSGEDVGRALGVTRARVYQLLWSGTKDHERRVIDGVRQAAKERGMTDPAFDALARQLGVGGTASGTKEAARPSSPVDPYIEALRRL